MAGIEWLPHDLHPAAHCWVQIPNDQLLLLLYIQKLQSGERKASAPPPPAAKFA